MANNTHPPVSYERFPITPAMKATLKNYIVKQRQKKKEEEEQDAVLNRERKIREIKRQQDTATLEQTNEQIAQLEVKLEQLKKEKHDLFARLKRVLNVEEEQRRRVQQLQFQHAREASEVLAKVGPVPSHLLIVGASPSISAVSKPPNNNATSPAQAANCPPAKRPRSPSPHTPAQVQAGRHSSGSHGSSSSSGFLSPKHTPNCQQRSPYQQAPSQAGGLFSPKAYGPPQTGLLGADHVRLPHPPQHPPVSHSTFQRAPSGESRSFNSHFEVRPVVSQATHLPARIPQHISQLNIPVVPQQKQVGSITTGFPLQKPLSTGNPPTSLPTNRPNRPLFSPKNSVPQQYPQHSYHRM